MRVLGHSLKSRDRNSSKPQLPNINRKNHWDFPFFVFIPPCMSVLPYIFANKFSLLLHLVGGIWLHPPFLRVHVVG